MEENALEGIAEATTNTTSVISDFFSSIGLAGISSLLSAVVVFLICLIVIKILTALTDKLFAKSKHLDETVKRFMRTALKIAMWALAIIIIAGALGIPTASLVAVVSVAGLALSLSVQNILSNLFSGITLLFTRPLSVGDYVDIGANSGTVDQVGMFYTIINTPNNQVITIPNSDVTSAAIVNYTRLGRRRVQFVFGAAYDDPTQSVKDALMDAAAQCPKVFTEPAPFVFISAYKDSSIEYTMNLWCQNSDYWDVIAAINESVRECYDKHGVHMSYNHLNVHMIQD